MQIFTASNILFKIVDSSHSSMRRLTVSMDEFRNLKSLHVLDLNYSRLSCICSLTGCKELSRLQELATSLGEEDTVDIISNFIADKDPMLLLFLSICFVHRDCYQAAPPRPPGWRRPTWPRCPCWPATLPTTSAS